MWNYKGIWIQAYRQGIYPRDVQDLLAKEVFATLLKRYKGNFNKVLSFVKKNKSQETWLLRWFLQRLTHYGVSIKKYRTDGDIFRYLYIQQIYGYEPEQPISALFNNIFTHKETLLSAIEKDQIGKRFMYDIFDLPFHYYVKSHEKEALQDIKICCDEEWYLPGRHSVETMLRLLHKVSSEALDAYFGHYPKHRPFISKCLQTYAITMPDGGHLYRPNARTQLADHIFNLDIPICWDFWQVHLGIQNKRSITEKTGALWNAYYLREPSRVTLLQTIYKGVFLKPSEVLTLLKNGALPNAPIQHHEVALLF